MATTPQAPSPGRVERLKLHMADAKAREFYSIQRIDLLVISVSGAGVYIVFETLKFLTEQKLIVDRCLVLWGGGVFVGAILLNFASQWMGYYANMHEACWAQYMHKKEGQEPWTADDDDQLSTHDKKGGRFGWWLRSLNLLSTGTMLVGVLLLAIFYFTRLPMA